MRKLLFIIVLLTLTLMLLGNSQAAFNGILLKDFPVDSLLEHSISPGIDKRLGDIIVLPETQFNEAEAAMMIARIDRLPDSMLQKISGTGIHVKLFEGKLTDNPTARYLSGTIPRGYHSQKTWDDVPGIGGSKTVLAKIGYSDKGMGHGSVNLELHELAHSIDRYVYSEIRSNGRFLQIWQQDRAKLFPGQDYFISYPEEYFAEAFAMFYVGGDAKNTLAEKAPDTYEFIKDLK